MAKRRLILLLGLVLALLLAACAPLTQNVTDLLRAPALGQGMDDIQNALSAYLGGDKPQYKFPKEGEWRSPILRADLDADGQSEAVVLYSVADDAASSRVKGNYVWVAVLKQQDGAWTVMQDMQGLSTDVASMEVAQLLEDGTSQLLVGFATASLTSRTLALYTYNNDTLTQVHQFDYSRYEIGDFTGQEKSELVVVGREDQPSGLTFQYVPAGAGGFAAELPEPVLLDVNFGACVGIAPGNGPDGQRVVVIDGRKENQMDLVYSQFVYYSGERFFTVDDSGALMGATGRMNLLMLSRDIDGDGVVEIPLRLGSGEIQTMAGDKKLEYVRWMDFTGEEAEQKRFGLLDSDRAVCILLPNNWEGEVSVVDGEEAGEWKLLERKTQTVLLGLRVVPQGGAPPVGGMLVPQTTNTYLVVGGGVRDAEKNRIEMVPMRYTSV